MENIKFQIPKKIFANNKTVQKTLPSNYVITATKVNSYMNYKTAFRKQTTKHSVLDVCQ